MAIIDRITLRHKLTCPLSLDSNIDALVSLLWRFARIALQFC
jgi:hypothetical protein